MQPAPLLAWAATGLLPLPAVCPAGAARPQCRQAAVAEGCERLHGCSAVLQAVPLPPPTAAATAAALPAPNARRSSQQIAGSQQDADQAGSCAQEAAVLPVAGTHVMGLRLPRSKSTAGQRSEPWDAALRCHSRCPLMLSPCSMTSHASLPASMQMPPENVLPHKKLNATTRGVGACLPAVGDWVCCCVG